MFKKIAFFAATIAAVIIMSAAVFADEIGVAIDGIPVNFGEQGPVIVDGRTLVPVRAVFEALGFTVGWYPDIREVSLRGSDILIVTIDSPTFSINGQSRPLEVAAQIINGSTMLPIRALVEAIGLEVGWDSATQTVTINHPRALADLSALEQQIHSLINTERASANLPPLSRNSALDALAREHSVDMNVNNLSGVAGSDGANNAERMARLVAPMVHPTGHAFRFNIDLDNINAEYIFARIMDSNSRANNINHEFIGEAGIGLEIREVSATRATIFVTQKFGAPMITATQQFEAYMLAHINAFRANSGLQPLSACPDLQSAAEFNNNREVGRQLGTLIPAQISFSGSSFPAANAFATLIENQTAVSPGSAVGRILSHSQSRETLLRSDITRVGIDVEIVQSPTTGATHVFVTQYFGTLTEVPRVAEPLYIPRLLVRYSYEQVQTILEQEIVRIANEIRQSYGLPAVRFHAELHRIARHRAQESTDYGYISGHISHLTGLAHTSHARAMGLNVQTAGENWAGGRHSPQAVMDSWMNSAGHRNFILAGHATSTWRNALPYIAAGVAFDYDEFGNVTNFNWVLWQMTPR
jgi:uncharacterized protein YkwD